MLTRCHGDSIQRQEISCLSFKILKTFTLWMNIYKLSKKYILIKVHLFSTCIMLNSSWARTRKGGWQASVGACSPPRKIKTKILCGGPFSPHDESFFPYGGLFPPYCIVLYCIVKPILKAYLGVLLLSVWNSNPVYWSYECVFEIVISLQLTIVITKDVTKNKN